GTGQPGRGRRLVHRAREGAARHPRRGAAGRGRRALQASIPGWARRGRQGWDRPRRGRDPDGARPYARVVRGERLRGQGRAALGGGRRRGQPRDLSAPGREMSICILHGQYADAKVVRQAFQILKRHRVAAWEADRDAAETKLAARLKSTNLIVTLGGDGTFLAGARLAAP